MEQPAVQAGAQGSDAEHAAAALHAVVCLVAAASKAEAGGEREREQLAAVAGEALSSLQHHHAQLQPQSSLAGELLGLVCRALRLPPAAFQGLTAAQLRSSLQPLPAGAQPARGGGLASLEQLLAFLQAAASDEKGPGASQAAQALCSAQRAARNLQLYQRLAADAAAPQAQCADALAVLGLPDADLSRLLGLRAPPADGGSAAAWAEAASGQPGAAERLLEWARTAAGGQAAAGQGAEQGSGAPQREPAPQLQEGLEQLVQRLEAAAGQSLGPEAAAAALAAAATEAQALEGAAQLRGSSQLAACRQLLAGLQQWAAECPAAALGRFVSGRDVRQLCASCRVATGEAAAAAAAEARQQLAAREEALVRLAEAEAAASQGQHQFLSGLLHNLAKALATEQPLPALQLAALMLAPGGEGAEQEAGDGAEPPPPGFLSCMLTYIAEAGDRLALTDAAPGEAHNYFALLELPPAELARRLAAQHGCSAAVVQASAQLGADAAAEALAALLPRVAPAAPGGGGWAAFAAVLARLRAQSGQQAAAPEAVAPAEGGGEAVWAGELAWLAGTGGRGQLGWLAPVLSPAGARLLRQLTDSAAAAQPVAAAQPAAAAAKRRGRLPGLSGNEPAELRLSLALLEGLAAAAPARAALAAVIALLHRRGGLALGRLPLAQPGSRPAAAAEAGEGAASDAELLRFARGAARERFPLLHGWLALQLATNPALADLREGRGGAPAALDRATRESRLQELAAAGEWEAAVQLAEQAPGAPPAPDWLLCAALAAVAPQLAPAGWAAGRRPASPPGAGRLRRLALGWAWCVGEPGAAGEAALTHLRAWDLQQARQLLLWTAGNAAPGPLQARLLERWRLLGGFAAALQQPAVAAEFQCWQQLDALCESDAAYLAARLAAGGAHGPALAIAEQAGLPRPLVREARAGFLAAALQGPGKEPLGLLHVVKHLRLLPPAERAAVGLAVLQRLRCLDQRSALIDVLAAEADQLPPASRAALRAAADGTAALRLVGEPWRGRLAHLACAPALLLETLVMAQELEAARKLLGGVPALRDDALLLRYARKALSFEDWHRPADRGADSPGPAPSAGSPQARPGSGSPGGSPRLPGTGTGAAGGLAGAAARGLCVLQGEEGQDAALRAAHRFRTAPNARLAAALLALAASPRAAAGMCEQLAGELLAEQLAGPWQRLAEAPAELERAAAAAEAASALLGAADDLSASDAGAGSRAPAGGGGELLRRRAQALRALLTKQVPVSADDMDSATQVRALVARLVEGEQYALAAFVSQLWALDAGGVWEAWAAALLEVGEYEEAEACLARAFQPPADSSPDSSMSDDSSRESAEARALRFVGRIEAVQPVNLGAAIAAVEAREAALVQEEGPSLEAAPFLQVLRQASRAQPSLRQAALESWPEARLEGRRYSLAERLLTQHAPAAALGFMFREGRAAAACRLLFPPGGETGVAAANGGVADANGGAATAQGRATAAEEGGEAAGGPVTLRFGDAGELLALAVRHGELRTLQLCLAQGGGRGRAALHGLCCQAREAVRQAASSDSLAAAAPGSSPLAGLPEQQLLLLLRRGFLSLNSPLNAGRTCLRLAWAAESHEAAAAALRDAALHFRDALQLLQRAPPQPGPQAGGGRASAQQLTSLLTRAGLQAALHERLQQEGRGGWASPPRAAHLLPETEDGCGTAGEAAAAAAARARQVEVVCRLVPAGAELAFSVVHACGLPLGEAYAAAVERLAAAGDLAGVQATLGSIQGATAAAEFDRVVAAAAAAWQPPAEAGGLPSAWAASLRLLGRAAPDPAEALVARMHSPQARVAALLQLGRLQAAADCAVAARSASLVRTVAQAARAAGGAPALAACEHFLASQR